MSGTAGVGRKKRRVKHGGEEASTVDPDDMLDEDFDVKVPDEGEIAAPTRQKLKRKKKKKKESNLFIVLCIGHAIKVAICESPTSTHTPTD